MATDAYPTSMHRLSWGQPVCASWRVLLAWAEIWKWSSAKPPGLCSFTCWVENCTKPGIWRSGALFCFIYFHFFLSSLRRWCTRPGLLLAVIRFIPVPSAEELSWGTFVSILHMTNVTNEATIHSGAIWQPQSPHLPLPSKSLCLVFYLDCFWTFTATFPTCVLVVGLYSGWQSMFLGCWMRADMTVWCRSHKPLVYDSRTSLSSLSPITAPLSHPQAAAKPHLYVLGSFLLIASPKVSSHYEVPLPSQN